MLDGGQTGMYRLCKIIVLSCSVWKYYLILRLLTRCLILGFVIILWCGVLVSTSQSTSSMTTIPTTITIKEHVHSDLCMCRRGLPDINIVQIWHIFKLLCIGSPLSIHLSAYNIANKNSVIYFEILLYFKNFEVQHINKPFVNPMDWTWPSTSNATVTINVHNQ